MEDRTNNEPEVPDETKKGKVIDLLIPIICLVVCCVIGMIYTGGFFGGADIPYSTPIKSFTPD